MRNKPYAMIRMIRSGHVLGLDAQDFCSEGSGSLRNKKGKAKDRRTLKRMNRNRWARQFYRDGGSE